MVNNSFTFIGRTTADVELRKTTSGESVVSFSLAVDRGYGNNKDTDFFDMVAWNKTAEYIAQYVKKGNLIACEGHAKKRKFEDKNGNKRTATEFVVSDVKSLSTKAESTESMPKPAGGVFTPEADAEGDLPFD